MASAYHSKFRSTQTVEVQLFSMELLVKAKFFLKTVTCQTVDTES